VTLRSIVQGAVVFRLLLLLYLVSALSSVGAQSVVELTYVTAVGTRTSFVAADLKRLYVYQSDATKILGLAALHKLEEVVFEIPVRMRDFSFLNENRGIKVLYFMDCSFTNLDFLYEQSLLRDLVLQSCNLSNNKIDLSRLESLEYLEITNSKLKEVPLYCSDQQHENPRKCMNIAYNQITIIPLEMARLLDNFNFVVITGNPMKPVSSRYLDGDLEKVLPPEYRKYIR
jgi:hypothetical protein